MKLCRVIVIALFLLSVCSSVCASETVSVRHLRCAYLQDPEGIDNTHPRLAWIVESALRGERQTAFRVLVANSLERLNADRGELWDSGKVQSSANSVNYSGAQLRSGHLYFWKVMVWDKNGTASEWSSPAKWSMGLLQREDWHGRWIGADVDEDRRDATFGYQSQPSLLQDESKWVMVDLGSVRPVDQVILHPATRLTGLFTPGYGFPLRFRIEGCLEGDCVKPALIADESRQDYPNPGFANKTFSADGIQARFIRVTATKLWSNDAPGTDVPFRFALAEMEVVSGKVNVALGADVISKDSLEGEGWRARYLVDGKRKYDPRAAHVGNAAVHFRKEFVVPRMPERATAYISALGYGELYVNGARVGDRVLDPGFTDYSKRVYYSAYDVTGLIAKGPNTIGILCGNGWFHLVTEDLFGFEKAPWTAPPQVLMNLVLEYKDGSQKVVSTDETWRWSTGAITYNSVRGGETQDARLEMLGWSVPSYNDTGWRNVKAVAAPAGHLAAQEEQPVRVVASIPAIKLSEPKPGVYLYDLGVNITGWVRFTAHGVRGQKITLEFNERLNPDGTLNAKHEGGHTRGRFQTGELILSGKKQDAFEPHFTYHGFQYVQITGLTSPPSLGDLTGKWVHTDMQQTGHFVCSNEKLNKIQNAILRTQLNYVVGYPNDPLREKMGWTQDVFNDFQVGALNFDVAPVYRRWFRDLLDAQDADGHEPSIAPTNGWARTDAIGRPGVFADVWWGGALIALPWLFYQNYGDASLLQEGYPAAKKYMDYLGRHAKNDSINWGLGDWGDSPGKVDPRFTPTKLTVTAGYYYLATVMQRGAELLGKTEDAKEYSLLATRIKDTLNRDFFDARSGKYSTGSQTAQALPLYLGMVPPDRSSLAVDQLVEGVYAANGHLTTGFVGLLPLMHVLTETGNAALAYRIATQEDAPGWWNMIKDGKSTVGEYWNPSVGTRNLLNLAGPAGQWYYEALAGIRTDPERPGYTHFIISPQIVGDLAYAEGETSAPTGVIRSSWHVESGVLHIDISVPVNSSATVRLPVKSGASVEEHGTAIGAIPEISSIQWDDKGVSFELASGTYSFAAPLADKDSPVSNR